MTPVLSPLDLIAVSGLLFLAAALSLALSLGLACALLIGGIRMTVQLMLLATLLRLIFDAGALWATLLAMIAMSAFAGIEVLLRQSRIAGRGWTVGVGMMAMLTAGMVIVLPTLIVVLQAEPWWRPQVALPIFGMIAGNAMTSVALTLDRMTGAIRADATMIETRLALGQPRLKALSPVLRDSIRAGLMPVLNSMSAIGLVTIPGMMTGQLLANADPFQAAKYQMLAMFLIAGVSALSAIGVAYALLFRLTDGRHRLRLERLHNRRPL